MLRPTLASCMEWRISFPPVKTGASFAQLFWFVERFLGWNEGQRAIVKSFNYIEKTNFNYDIDMESVFKLGVCGGNIFLTHVILVRTFV